MKKNLVYTNDISSKEFKGMLRDYMTDEEVSSMSYDELYNRMSEYSKKPEWLTIFGYRR